MEIKKLSLLVRLDLTAAFDTVDHSVLLDRLHSLIGLSGSVFNWFKSFLSDREFYVTMDECSSKIYKMDYGVPQGSILGQTHLIFTCCPLEMSSGGSASVSMVMLMIHSCTSLCLQMTQDQLMPF